MTFADFLGFKEQSVKNNITNLAADLIPVLALLLLVFIILNYRFLTRGFVDDIEINYIQTFMQLKSLCFLF
jgi:hypothetical protein